MGRPITIELRKVIAALVVALVGGLLAVQYLRLVGPAAAREAEAACNGLRPSASNPALGILPTIAPDFTVTDHQGKPVQLSSFRGKVVLVNFWATWCNVCKAEKPGLEDLATDMMGDDFVVVTLASDTEWETIRKAFPAGTPLPVYLDPPVDDENIGQVARSWGIKAVPESFLIDREGRIRHYFINKRDWNSGVARTCIRSIVDE